MSKEDLILEKLGKIEAELAVMREAREPMDDLIRDLNPIMKQALYVMVNEFKDVEDSFQLEDVMPLVKKVLVNVKNLTWALEALETIIDMWHTMEPMMKSALHNTVRYLGTLEQRGVFRTYEAMLEVRAKVAQHYGPEDIEAMGDSFVTLLGLLKKMSNPEMLALLEKITDMPANIDLANAKPVGMFGVVGALSDSEVKNGIGVAMEMVKALGKLK
ncbi:hypothetical protein NNJEOMEG_00177 [Fundidesulfovibrio magnetotacticus]|uniref:DUF1641 domain-containing protein n=1 Tax=Fundidesulfovibrio magnetotacticus TaxID=2730080 RepID=A0A6V8LHZ1_9BACT|nr:DUF1641 domain-containing protein [Fundidesulfovibrio magnetotacticus]GFK92352.1 hypothetical protein NNJEOMEG_00177 [Fundidesulfovibrio magnetotacticus]